VDEAVEDNLIGLNSFIWITRRHTMKALLAAVVE
jgi:hypothetical protein